MRFTQLVREDHANEAKERDTKIEANREEERVERKIGEMMQAILRRYHEEQIWSDKVSHPPVRSMFIQADEATPVQIRSVSTYGSLAITGVNVLIFLLALILVEPWKRKRLVREVEARISDRDAESRQTINERLDILHASIGRHEGIHAMNGLDLPSGQAALPTAELDISPQHLPLSDTENPDSESSASSADAANKRHRRDITYVGLAGAFLGAGVVAAVNVLFS